MQRLMSGSNPIQVRWSFYLLLALTGGIIGGLALPSGGALMIIVALALLGTTAQNPCLAGLWAATNVLISHRWLLDLHPLDWVGVPVMLSRPLVLVLWLFCAFAAAATIQFKLSI